MSITRRATLIKQVLVCVSSKLLEAYVTYMDPNQKRAMRENFCAVDVCSLQIAGSGRISNAKLVVISTAEATEENTRTLMHSPLIVLSQMKCTGLHLHASTIMTISAQYVEMTPMM